ncbi:4Fe-4S dicluster domain-containing protein [Rhizobium sp. ARZ01]|uniref:4Fe-4S dicluster domain-containing protein n=1 Tax=Rhizobium sp. ARZ01 TaxID=2769313 RepID=UPI00177F26E5|nr:4Fe-4S dicluster domain-containing protein [Rhizobium sp. ARZ01]MBD9372660.1 4Fe-4S dicluster domain-containing protein [Rhizobium sp. ARZ01]
MTVSSPTTDAIRAAFEPHGLFLRGVVNFDDDEAAPTLRNGDRAASVVLIGNVGGSIWPAFRAWQAMQTDRGGSDPLDAWSKTVMGPVAEVIGATPWFPSDAPWQPFQQWAMRAEGLRPSPLGILIHPQYGLWHGYRGALGFAQRLDQPISSDGVHPCDNCRGKPCLSVCPVAAVAADGFDVPGCRDHLRTDAGRRGCMASGCLARSACPVGAEYGYSEDQLRFHMAALSL